MTQKKRRLICAGIFLAVFAALLITATFTDLQVSRILTKNALPAGQYYANDVFGVLFECIGTCPELLICALCAELILIYVTRFWKKGAMRTAVQAVALIAVPVLYTWEFSDMIKYIFRHVNDPAEQPAFLWGIAVFLGLLASLLGIPAVNGFSDESIRKLGRFAVITLFAVVCGILLVQVIKNPVGRMRYRAMNVIGDDSGYTPWYSVNGQPDKEWMKLTFGTSDAFKSFPSGHTRAAAGSFYLTVMADELGVKSRYKKAALWILCTAFTVTVAVSRIVVGAHFFSDVLIGGAIGFCVVTAERIVLGKLKAAG